MDKDLNVLIDQLFANDEQRKVFIKVADAIEKKVRASMGQESFLVDSILNKEDKASRELQRAYEFMKDVWTNEGKTSQHGKKIELKRLLNMDSEIRAKLMADSTFASTDLPLMLPRIITESVREAIEPELALTPLYTRIAFPGRGTQVSFLSTSAVVAGEVGEGQEPQTSRMEMDGTVVATIGRYGTAVRLTEDAIEYSQYDIVGMHVRAALRAMARLKEQKAFEEMRNNATVLLSNDSTSYKSTTGRNALGAYNGTMTVYDFFYAWSKMHNDNGYIPNTLVMNPFGWLVFAQDPMMRQMFMNNGSGRLLQLPQGQPGRAQQWNLGGLNNVQNVTSRKEIATSFTTPPAFWPGNINVVVSPWVDYNSDGTTDIYICDSNNLGLLVEEDGLKMTEWKDPARDIRAMKWIERYGYATFDEGRAIGKIEGVSIARGYDFSDKLQVALDPANFTGGSSVLTLDDHFRPVSFSGQVP